MAFIGPRPGAAHFEEELVIQRETYLPSAFCVKPGLSGYAQLQMKREHDPCKKAKLDSEYVSKISFWLDTKLCFGTIIGVFGTRKGR